MAKYSFEFKKKVVDEYLRGEEGRNYLAYKYDIASSQMIIQWVNNYKTFGDEGVMRSRKNDNYSFDKETFCCRIVFIK